MLLVALAREVGGTDLRASILKGGEPYFHFTPEKRLFQINCSVLHWKIDEYDAETYISLGVKEIFDGGGRRSWREGQAIIDLSNIELFEGLFRIKNEVKSFSDDPKVRNAHFKYGTTATYGGFIIQKGGSGGICGFQSAYSGGQITILNCYSTGQINGDYGGGSTGSRVANAGGVAQIPRSSENIKWASP